MNTKTNLALLGILLAAVVNGVAQPILTCQPSNQSAIAGSNVTFTVCATGIPPLSYQWRSHATLTDYTNIPFGTEVTLVLTNVQPTAIRFGVVVTDGDGLSATSVLARLTVSVPPSILSQPAGQIVVAGSSVTISLVATGVPAPSIQWRFNGTDLLGRTGSSLTLANVQPTNSGE